MEPLTWRPGFHGREDFAMNSDPDLRLIHLHRMDYELCRARHQVRRRKPWAEIDGREGWAVHNQLADEDAEFNRWFYEQAGFAGAGFDHFRLHLEEIAPMWRGLF
jgi:hypothetical protein